MSAPEFVPTSPTARKSYQSPKWRPGSWHADRPGELDGRQPEGDRLGAPGPDPGYVDRLVDTVESSLKLGHHEHLADVREAIAVVALKRASLFGRAPVIHDVTAAVTALGFDQAPPSGDAGERRAALLEECHHPHFYVRLRSIADLVEAEVLAQPAAKITSAVANW
ncbi:MAG: hypothetical protein M9952_08795 [Microthrixaceae bacterium]|nr:hypothetical protein [Microthrixaceae bacterium]MCO5313014.1 hypothetical protein [Microthrixaceae bacterium]HPB46674.1 hypothetical protein [Microthrixaceae bacterium]